ncbi:MAG: hypothetical protein EAZ55_14790 [Cytophagales bacterium]|nr:MAG: hypothetical protein EAZ55_14790 [Cytophagales bacterium]
MKLIPKNTIYFLILLTFSTFLGLTSCNNTSQVKINIHFDLNGLLDAQIVLLEQLAPKVNKSTITNGEKEAKEVKIKKWANELAMFRQADINKSGLKGSYQIKDSISKSGEKFTVYTTDKAHLNVKYLRIGSGKNINSIYAVLVNDNYLYHADKQFALFFTANAEGKPLLKNYSIRGNQKIIFTNPENYLIEAECLMP